MKGRSWLFVPANLEADVHVDVEYLEDRPSTLRYRAWMQKVLKKRPGTRQIQGRATDSNGKEKVGNGD